MSINLETLQHISENTSTARTKQQFLEQKRTEITLRNLHKTVKGTVAVEKEQEKGGVLFTAAFEKLIYA